MLRVNTNAHRIAITGELSLDDFRRILATMHNLRTKAGYEELLLDFNQCTYVAPGSMATICAEALRLQQLGVDTSVVLPGDHRLRNLFLNANWAHFLEPTRHGESTFKGFSHVPLAQFAASSEQGALVSHLVDTLLKSTGSVAREDFAAIEWALNEITDNVLIHAQSEVGGVVHLNNYADKKRVEVIVADPGLGVPRTLRTASATIRSDADALEQAIREGVTRDPSVGQGNGLYGSYRIATSSGGYFYLHSGLASLEASQGYLKIHAETIPYHGTLVVACMDYSQRNALAEALEFGGRKYRPTDFIETRYELDAEGAITVLLASEGTAFGSRDAGAPIRRKLLNIYSMGQRLRSITVDLSGVPLVSSSYADEVFGKLFVELGPMEFMRVFRITGANPTVQELVNRAILQRSRQADG